MTISDLEGGLELAFNLKSSKEQDRSVIIDNLQRLTGFNDLQELFDCRSVPSKFRKLFDYQVQKFCTTCLIDSYHIRANWDYKNYVACHIHNTPLELLCDNCQSLLSTESLMNRVCAKCAGAISLKKGLPISTEPVSGLIANAMNDVEKNVTEKLIMIESKLHLIEPYFRLQFNGSIKAVRDIRKSNIQDFISIQSKAYQLQYEPSKSAELLADQFNDVSKSSTLSSIIHKYSSVVNEPNKHKFSNVLKSAVTHHKLNDSEQELTINFISKLWQIDESKLIQALDKINPQLRKGKQKVSCQAFANNLDKLLAQR